jgi:hypothetical protein
VRSERQRLLGSLMCRTALVKGQGRWSKYPL